MNPWEDEEAEQAEQARVADDQYAAETAWWQEEWTRERAQDDEDDAR